jgi:perosamine synthetase
MKNKLPFSLPTLQTSSKAIIPKIIEVVENQKYVDGKNVRDLEKKLNSRYNRKVVAVSNGTSGLIVALNAIIEDKKEVIVPSLSFSATIQSIIHADAKPVFVDIYEDNWTMDVNDVERKINENTGSIMPVNLFGVPCDIESFEKLGQKYNIPIIYDSCQAFGAKSPEGEIGSFGDIEVFSLDASKILTAGTGGFITVKNDCIFDKIILAKNFGNNSQKIPQLRGINARMHEFNAILANNNLQDFNINITVARKNAEAYKILLSNIDKISLQKANNKLSSPQFFGIFLDHPDSKIGYKLQKQLLKKGIETRIYNPSNLHQNSIFSKKKITLNITEKMCSKILCLPTHRKVESHHRRLIKETILEVLK